LYKKLRMTEECVSKKKKPSKKGKKLISSMEINLDSIPDVKKRGRKPKGGKIIVNPPETMNIQVPIINVLMHLKCSLKDLNGDKTHELVKDPLSYDPSIPPEIKTYNDTTTNQFAIYNEEEKGINIAYNESICLKCKHTTNNENGEPVENIDTEYSDIHMKDIYQKLKYLRIQYCKNYPIEKNAACFWCTYEFDNPACFIPKYHIDDSIIGYGSFCRPECAVAFLMRDNLDDSTKFERYHLLNQMYGKIYGFKKNIKPAPDPHYLLDKFYGNLTIQEYRKLLKTEYLLQVLDKPMTRILPEVHEENDDFILNVYGGVKQQIQNTGGVYKVKRQSDKQKKPTKNSIVRNNFGLCE